MAGCPFEQIQQLEQYDPDAHAGDLDETKVLLLTLLVSQVLMGLIPGEPCLVHNHLVQTCIAVLIPDGYEEEERSTMRFVAHLLGMAPEKLEEIETTTLAEHVARQARIAAVGSLQWSSTPILSGQDSVGSLKWTGLSQDSQEECSLCPFDSLASMSQLLSPVPQPLISSAPICAKPSTWGTPAAHLPSSEACHSHPSLLPSRQKSRVVESLSGEGGQKTQQKSRWEGTVLDSELSGGPLSLSSLLQETVGEGVDARGSLLVDESLQPLSSS